MGLKKNSSVATNVFDSHFRFWKNKLRGVQLFGKGYKTNVIHIGKGTLCFIKRFPEFKELVKKPKDFMKKAVSVKLYTLQI